MSQENSNLTDAAIPDPASGLKSYRAPWKGQIVLVCRKCEKKLKHRGKNDSLGKLRKELKKRTRHNEEAQQLRVIEVSCLKMCPKGGVTVCTQQQLENQACCIVRSNADIDVLVSQALESQVLGSKV